MPRHLVLHFQVLHFQSTPIGMSIVSSRQMLGTLSSAADDVLVDDVSIIDADDETQ